MSNDHEMKSRISHFLLQYRRWSSGGPKIPNRYLAAFKSIGAPVNTYDTPNIGPDEFLYAIMCDLDVDLPIRVQAAKALGYLLQLRRPVRPPFVAQRYQQVDLFTAGPHDHHFVDMYDPSEDLHQRMNAADALMSVGQGNRAPVRELNRLYEAGMTLTEFNEMLVQGHA
jgi:hypothetical protein